MMLRQSICLLVITICLNFGTPKVLKKPAARDTSNAAMHRLFGTTDDYDYFAPQPRRAPYSYQKSNPTTTERPFIRYWNNFVRNIRLPVPHITWNMTNPLVNLFNGGVTNVIDSPVGNYHHSNTKRKRRKNTRKQTDTLTKRTKKRKHAHTAYEGEEAYQTAGYADYEEPYTVSFDPRETMYFYDARTGQYYKLQDYQTQHLNIYAPPGQQQQPYEMDEEAVQEEATEEPVRQVVPVAAQIDAPTMEAAVESIESGDESMEQSVEEHIVPDSQEIKDSAEVELIPPEVENIDEFEEENTPGRQSINDIKLNVKNMEKLRNSIGSYMTDDRFNRMRQRANPKQKTKSMRSRVKSQPRKKFAYYILQPV